MDSQGSRTGRTRWTCLSGQPGHLLEVRDRLAELVCRDLLGPWDGEHEVFAPRAMGPREWYLVGMLGPRRTPRSWWRRPTRCANRLQATRPWRGSRGTGE